jgi:hypothetical protein
MGGKRKALIVANDEYEHEALRRLKAPSADARALARVLGDRDIGGFNVDAALNQPAHDVEAQIEDLFADSQPDDILLLHFSCHGLKSEAGELFFAARNTRPDRLGSTAIAADFIQRCIKSCRARSIVLFLDCCYGGAFGQGVSVRASGSANVLESFPSGKLGGGKGRAVITASSSMEYAFEGNELAEDHQQPPSLFTAALVQGLETGEADHDEDGLVSLNELYDYVFDKVREQNPNQTPGRDVEMQGELYVARSQRKKVRPLPIPAEVQAALLDRNMFTRLGAVSELRARLSGEDIAAALGAQAALADLSRTDIKYVGDAAAEALGGAVLRVTESELGFGEVERGATASLVLHLSGPPIARACTFSTSDRWISIEEVGAGPQVSVDTTAAGRLRGSITVKGPTGEAVVPVSVDVIPAVVNDGKAIAADAKPVAVDANPVTPPAPAVTPAGVGLGDPAQGSGAPRPPLLGWVVLAGGALMVLGVALPFQWDTSTMEQAPSLAWYLLLLGGMALAGGVCSLIPQTRQWVGPGLVLGITATSTWGLAYLIGHFVDSDGGGFNLGFLLDVVAHLLLIAAGCVAAVALAGLDEVHIRSFSRHDRIKWLMVFLGVAGALLVLLTAIDVWQSDAGLGALAAWLAFLSIALPVTSVLLRPRRLGIPVMAGWLVSGLALTINTGVVIDTSGGDTTKIDAFFISLLALAAATVVWSRQKDDTTTAPRT